MTYEMNVTYYLDEFYYLKAVSWQWLLFADNFLQRRCGLDPIEIFVGRSVTETVLWICVSFLCHWQPTSVQYSSSFVLLFSEAQVDKVCVTLNKAMLLI